MTTSDWPRVEAVLDGALDLPPEDRAPYLDEACAGDDALRAEVERLLRADAAARADEARFLEQPLDPSALGFAAPEEPDLAPGARVGPYRVVREIGRGGMGVVYLALRDDGQFEQEVAVKVVAQGGTGLRRRFLAERQMLARLAHPNIARLLDGGLTNAGVPYLVMEHVEGEPITAYADRLGLSVDERLRLFLGVCGAVHHAHQRLVVHRDLKPSNILVTPAGQVKLLDFGVAKLLADGADGADAGDRTRTGGGLMTPEYAAPEQVRGEAATTATDVYALGVLLYELLTGQRAHRLATGSLAEIARVVCDELSPRPSTAVTHTAGPNGSATPAARRLRGDLDTIVLRALAKEPARRYPSVEALAADLRRHLAHLPVTARPDTPGYRAGRFIRRNRTAVAATAAMLALLVTVVAVYTVRLAAERDHARRAQAEAERTTDLLRGLFAAAGPASEGAENRDRPVSTVLDDGVRRLDVELRGQPALHARLLTTVGRVYADLGAYARAETVLSRALTLAPHGPVAAEALAEMGVLSGEQSRYDRADSLYRVAEAESRGAVGPEAPLTLRILLGRATLARYQGRFGEADSLAHAVLAVRRQAPGIPPMDLAATLSELGVIARQRDSLDAALRFHGEALAVMRRVYPDEHPVVSEQTFALGLTLQSAGRLRRPSRSIAACSKARAATTAPTARSCSTSSTALACCCARWVATRRPSRSTCAALPLPVPSSVLSTDRRPP